MTPILRRATLQLVILGAMAVFSQLAFAANGLALVNAASYETVNVGGVNTGVVAPGSIAALFSAGMASGTNFAPPGVFPLPKTMGGAVVRINGIDSPLMYAAATQINLQVPFGLAAGTFAVEVYNNGVLVSSGNVIVVDSAPGVFTFDSSGDNQSATQNSIDYSINGNFEQFPGSRPEATGKYVTIYATGIGKTTATVADGDASPGGSDAALGRAIGTTTVTVGGVPAQVSFSGLAPGYVGLWQVNIVLPASLPTNMATSLKIDLNGHQTWSVKAPTIAVASSSELSTVSGNVVSALTGVAIGGADLSLVGNGKTRNAKADGQGNYSFYVLNGNYTLSAGASGFITATQDTAISGSKTIPFGLTAPLASSTEYRVVLSWTNAIDLDAHLTGPQTNGRFHVWWNGETDVANTPITAQFNRDDTAGIGPETLTFTASTGLFRFSVQNYTDRDYDGGRTLLNATGATVRVYKGSQQIAAFTAPAGGGTLWKVFEVNNGVFSAVNTITDEADPSNIKNSY